MALAAHEQSVPRHLPEKIGRFTPIKKLGRGAQGIVYLARDTQLEREVAIKTLTRKQQASASLLNEAKNVSKLNHKNIVTLHEIGVHESATYLVYGYIEGESLKQRLKSARSIPKIKAARLIARLLDALQYAHENGIVHRDLNPANILIDTEETPKILDFGISQSISADTTSDVSGTANYLAPEVLSNGEVGPQADLFSIGLVLHEMLTGRMVFKGENPMAVMYQVVNENILPPSKFNQDIDPALDGIVMRALQRDTGKRFRHAREMLNAVNEYLQGFESKDTEVGQDEAAAAKNGTLEFLLRRMQRKQDFPAISGHITEINQKASHSSIASASELSNVILKDYALTTKLLRLVNSCFYGQFGGEITTVSRAIIILGYEQVRTAALSIILFEHLNNDRQAEEMKLTAYSALMSGIIAREQAKKMKLTLEDDIESTFIASMFHNLGQLLSIYYFPDEYQEITHLMLSQGFDGDKAARSVLGLPFAEIGKGIAREWKLPGVMIESMNRMPAGPVKAPKNKDETIRQLSSFANELCAIGQLQPGEAARAKKALAERYEDALNMDGERIEALITSSQTEVSEFTRALKIDTRGIRMFAAETRPDNSDDDGADTNSVGSADEDPLSATSNSALERAMESGDTQAQNKARQEILMQGVTEITNCMLEDFDLNELLTMVLETIYRGMGFTRVLFCIRDARNRTINARFGLGKGIDNIIPQFRFSLTDEDDIVHAAIHRGKEFIILDVNSPEYRSRVPDYLRKVTQPRSVVLYPILVNRRVIGLLYADMDECAPDVSADALKFFKTLRNQAALAIQQKNSK